jgi:hypothetical protein
VRALKDEVRAAGHLRVERPFPANSAGLTGLFRNVGTSGYHVSCWRRSEVRQPVAGRSEASATTAAPYRLFERRRRVQDARRTTRTRYSRAVRRSCGIRQRRGATRRLGLGDGALLAEWKSAYKRGFVMQAALAIVGSVLGLLACWETNDRRWLVGALVLIANWPYPLFAIMPISNQLNAINSASAGSKSRMLIEQWGTLHAVRSVLGLAATIIFLWASIS